MGRIEINFRFSPFLPFLTTTFNNASKLTERGIKIGIAFKPSHIPEGFMLQTKSLPEKSSALALKVSQITMLEALLVAIALSSIAAMSGNRPTDWLGAAAVFITFLHGQLSFDLQESQSKMPAPDVDNYRWTSRLFVTKEILWITTFAIAGCWPLCAGSILFATYPHWRKALRQ